MSLLGILFGFLLLFLIGKALLETIWGIFIIGFGIVCHVTSWILCAFAMLLRILTRLNKAAEW